MASKGKEPSIQILDGWAKKARDKLELLGKSQRWLAEQIEYDQATVSRAISEDGDHRGGMTVFRLIAAKLELPIPWILIKEPEEAEWFELGMTIRELEPTLYAKLLRFSRRHAVALRTRAKEEVEIGLDDLDLGSDPPARSTAHESSSEPERDGGGRAPRETPGRQPR